MVVNHLLRRRLLIHVVVDGSMVGELAGFEMRQAHLIVALAAV